MDMLGEEREERGRENSCHTHCAFVWLLPSVTSHVNKEHVLSLEWLLSPHTTAPLTDEFLLAVPNTLEVGRRKRGV